MKFHLASIPGTNPNDMTDAVVHAACDTAGNHGPVWVARAHQVVDALCRLSSDLMPISMEFSLAGPDARTPEEFPAASSQATLSDSSAHQFILYAEGFLSVRAWRDEQDVNKDTPVWTRLFPVSVPSDVFSRQTTAQLALFDRTGQVKDMAVLFKVTTKPLERMVGKFKKMVAFAVNSLEMFVDAVTLVRPFEPEARLWPIADEQKDQCVSVCHGKVEFPHTAETCHTVSPQVLRIYPKRTSCGLPVCIGHRMTHAIICKSCALQQGLPFAHHFTQPKDSTSTHTSSSK